MKRYWIVYRERIIVYSAIWFLFLIAVLFLWAADLTINNLIK